ncbi:putative ATPase DUF699 [Ostertagia ostertagi]
MRSSYFASTDWHKTVKGFAFDIVQEGDPFEVFISMTKIRYCYYNETQNILGNTYGMLVLQDFEALTPNLLARTIETIEGGGIVVLLMKTVNSLRQLYTIAMNAVSPSEAELKALKDTMKDTKPIGPLLSKCRTACQGKALLRLLDVITDKDLNVTCSITAARGRGKSASLGKLFSYGVHILKILLLSTFSLSTLENHSSHGLALAGAVAFGYSNIFVTSPSPENLRTLFEFVMKGFDTDGLPEFQKALVRVNVFREHRQTIQYIHPSDASKLGQAELLVVDEAAAIPLPLVKELIFGPYIVFLASTINGYEGTGRSLSLKLLQQLRQQAAGSIEQWLNRVLCLNAGNINTRLSCGTPPPSECELYIVNRDALFSFHKASEAFLQQIMAIYVAAHYKNSPNDLQMLSDAPAHHLFVLMSPVKEDQSSLPEVLALAQVCLEGNLSKESVSGAMDKGKRAAGDLLPWTISQHFMDRDFPTLCGGRVVRIAVHPDFQSMGYGSRTLELLEEYYLGHVPSIDEGVKESVKTVKDGHTVALLEEQIAPRADLPPLLMRLTERKAERLDYLGVSFGLTLNLLKFWKKSGFVPVYLRQTPSPLTGEYTCAMLKRLDDQSETSSPWLAAYFREFRTRLLSLLSFEFRKLPINLGLSLLQVRNKEVSTALHCDRKITLPLLTNHLLSLQSLQVFALQSKTIRKLSDEFDTMCMDSIRELIPDKTRDVDKEQQSLAVSHLKPLAESLEDELNKAADEIRERHLRDKKALLEETEDLSQYEINVDTKTLAKASDIKMIYSRPLSAPKRQQNGDDGSARKKKKLFKKRGA